MAPGHQHGLWWGPKPWASIWPLVVSQPWTSTQIPDTNPDMALGSNLPVHHMPPGGHVSLHISLFLTATTSPVPLLPTAHEQLRFFFSAIFPPTHLFIIVTAIRLGCLLLGRPVINTYFIGSRFNVGQCLSQLPFGLC